MAGQKISDLVNNPQAEADYTREAFIHAAQDGGDVWARLTQVLGVSYDPATRRLFGAGGWSVTLPFAKSTKPEISEPGNAGLISAADQAKLDGRPEPMQANQDANALLARGASYRRDAESGTPTNLPTSSYGIVRVFGRAADRLIQYYDEVGSSGPGRLWRRTLNADGFSAWRSFLMSGDGAAIRDALGALTGDSRIDAGAIKNLEATIISVLADMDPGARAQLLMGLSAGMVGPGEVWMTKIDGTGITGLGVGVEDVASQQDILEGSDVGKTVTAAAAGGFDVVRTIPYAATLTVDFSGGTPVWGSKNVVTGVVGSVALRAATFPAYMEGREFTVRFVRGSGTGAVTLQSAIDGAKVVYIDELTSAAMPVLGPVPGDWVEVTGKVFNSGTWGVVDFDAWTAPKIDISGGAITTPTGYKVSTFATSGTLTVTGGGTLNYEIVAGGGAAGGPSSGTGGSRGGGGGAGEIRRGSLSLGAGTYAITVGAGGAFAAAAPGNDGGSSTAFDVTALGGGGGGGGNTFSLGAGRNGGSGGGAAGWDSNSPAGGSAIGLALGHAGGVGGFSSVIGDRRGGGGGGANTAGVAGTTGAFTGTGGTGLASACPGIAATYAAGGNAYLGSAPVASSLPGSGGHAAAGGAAGTPGAAGIVHVWVSTT